MTFSDLDIPRQYLDAIADMGYEEPTPIQSKAIPMIRSGQHVIGIAQTGTGKTAAYLLPILQKLQKAQGDYPRVLILVPTKELVRQVAEHARALSKYTDIRIAALYGGVGRQSQAQQFQEKGADIIVSTPLRFLEMYEVEELSVKKIETLVLDEADRMMDMGFLPQLNMILDVLPRKKQNMLFSATFSPYVEELSWNFMDFPIKIEITPEATPVETVEQRRYETPNIQTKLNLICHLLRDAETFKKVIIFVKTKETANEVYGYIREQRVGGEIRLIHSNKGQNTRIHAFDEFKAGNIRVLISTDVMARGIDIPEVSHVINFDVPALPEEYVHRIGRTGRAQRAGCAITLVTKPDEYHIAKIEKKIRMAIPIALLPDAIEVPETPFEESQAMARKLDEQRKKADPTYQGAFHEKKSYVEKKKAKTEYSKSGKYIKSGTRNQKTSKHKR